MSIQTTEQLFKLLNNVQTSQSYSGVCSVLDVMVTYKELATAKRKGFLVGCSWFQFWILFPNLLSLEEPQSVEHQMDRLKLSGPVWVLALPCTWSISNIYRLLSYYSGLFLLSVLLLPSLLACLLLWAALSRLLTSSQLPPKFLCTRNQTKWYSL